MSINIYQYFYQHLSTFLSIPPIFLSISSNISINIYQYFYHNLPIFLSIFLWISINVSLDLALGMFVVLLFTPAILHCQSGLMFYPLKVARLVMVMLYDIYIYIILCNAYTDIYIYIAVLWYSRVQPRNQESPKITDLMLRFGGVWFQTHALPDLRWFGRGFRLQQRRRSGWRHV